MTHLNKFLSFLIGMLLWLAQPSYGQAIRERLLLDNNWKFTLGHATEPSKDLYYRIYNDFSKTLSKGTNFSSIDYDDSTWQTVDLPHDWAVTLPFSEKGDWSHGYKTLGAAFPEKSIGWYRKTFQLSQSQQGKRISLQFDGVFRDHHCWVNGIYVGHHLSGYTGVNYDITDLVDFTKTNVITIRVDATQNEGWFYEGAGIYRHVWLNTYSPIHSSPSEVFVYTKSIGTTAEIHAEATVHNQSFQNSNFTVEWTILNREKKVVATGKSPATSFAPNEKITLKSLISLPKPMLWDTERPYLYTLVTKIITNGKTADLIRTRFGVRTFSYRPDGFYLNDKKVKIKGVCAHQDHAGVGTALVDELQYYRIGLLKAMGANAYRTAHNPPTPELLQACDSLGMLVLDETRLMNSGKEYRQQFEDLIKRDRNHASVFMWCIGNEEEKIQSTETGARIARTLVSVQQHLDPSRVSTYGANVGNENEGVSAVIPVRGFNYNLYALADYEKAHPEQPILGTEVASTVSTRGVYLPEVVLDKAGGYSGHFVADTLRAYLLDQDKSYPSWASQAEQWYSATANDPRFMGGFVWTGFDYRGEPTPFAWPNINAHFGVMDVCGFPKNVYYYYKAQWSQTPVLHLAPHWNLNLPKGTMVKVWAYSNAEEVELFLNGKSLGKQKMPIFGHLQWDVPYEKGTLKAVGVKNGKPITTAISTTDAPAKIILTPHKTQMKAGKQDAVVVNVSVIDKKGREVPDAQNLIRFSLTGNATIAGVGNGDPSSHEQDVFAEGNHAERKLFNGKCQVIIRSGAKGGAVQLRATANGLKEAEVRVNGTLESSQAKIKVSKTQPRYFEQNGKGWIPIATNYLPSQHFEEVEKYFKHFAENGGNAMRIWISTEFLEIEDEREGQYNPEKLTRIDHLLQLAEKYHIYLKFTLHHLRTISNTIAPEAAWANSKSLATRFGSVSEYVTTKKGKQSYIKRLKMLAKKCKHHPYVYGWELWNEMDAVVPEAEWLPFTQEMLGKVKHVCSEQLVTQTLGSMHAPYMETYYQKIAVMPQNEFLSIHRYVDEGDTWHQYPAVKGAVDSLVSNAMAIGLEMTKAHPKPIIINEIGAVQPNHAGPFALYRKDTEGILLHDFIFAPFFCGSAGSGTTWHWDHYIEPNQLWFHFGRFKKAIEGIDPIQEEMQPFSFNKDKVNCYGLKGKTKAILWCRDGANNWKTELREGIPALTKKDFTLPLEHLQKVYTHCKTYDPWTDKWTTDLTIENGRVVLPPFKRSIVVVLEK